MLILLLVILLLMIFVPWWMRKLWVKKENAKLKAEYEAKDKYYSRYDMHNSKTPEGMCWYMGIMSVLAAITAIALLVNIGSLVNASTIDEKIAMYQEENSYIELQIETAVKGYMQYEKDIFTDCAPDSYINLVSLYPELKADSLVEQQIATYLHNRETIKSLREKKISYKVTRWWVYFG